MTSPDFGALADALDGLVKGEEVLFAVSAKLAEKVGLILELAGMEEDLEDLSKTVAMAAEVLGSD